MPLFDPPTTQYPRRWSEQSLDFRLFFIWEAALMATMILGSAGLFKNIPAAMFYGAIAAGAVVVISLSIANRRRQNWRWPGVTAGDVLKTIGAGALMALFFYVAFRNLPQARSSVPMILFGAAIAAMNVLTMLKLVQPSEIDFQSHCHDPLSPPAIAVPATPAEPAEPRWKRVVRGAYGVAFLAVWLEAMAFFYVHENYVRDGARHPTVTQTETINEHGTIVYLTPEQKHFDDMLQASMFTGIPAIMLGGLFSHFVLGVRMFNNWPARRGVFDPEGTVD
jgi:hypothetical protein